VLLGIAAHRKRIGDILTGRSGSRASVTCGLICAPRYRARSLHLPLRFACSSINGRLGSTAASTRARLAPSDLSAPALDLERLRVMRNSTTRFPFAETPSWSPIAQGDVVMFGIDPACAGKAATQIGKVWPDLARDFQSRKLDGCIANFLEAGGAGLESPRPEQTPATITGNYFYPPYMTLRACGV